MTKNGADPASLGRCEAPIDQDTPPPPRHCLALMMKAGMYFSLDSSKDLVIGSSRYPRQVGLETHLKQLAEISKTPESPTSTQEEAKNRLQLPDTN